MINEYQKDLLTFDPNGTIDWFKQHPNAPTKYKDLDNWIHNDLMTTPINEVKIHAKLESLLKEINLQDI